MITLLFLFFFFNDPATTEIYTLSLHDALPILDVQNSVDTGGNRISLAAFDKDANTIRSEEHTSELQSPDHLVCRLLLEKKKTNTTRSQPTRSRRARDSPSPPSRTTPEPSRDNS